MEMDLGRNRKPTLIGELQNRGGSMTFTEIRNFEKEAGIVWSPGSDMADHIALGEELGYFKVDHSSPGSHVSLRERR